MQLGEGERVTVLGADQTAAVPEGDVAEVEVQHHPRPRGPQVGARRRTRRKVE